MEIVRPSAMLRVLRAPGYDLARAVQRDRLVIEGDEYHAIRRDRICEWAHAPFIVAYDTPTLVYGEDVDRPGFQMDVDIYTDDGQRFTFESHALQIAGASAFESQDAMIRFMILQRWLETGRPSRGAAPVRMQVIGPVFTGQPQELQLCRHAGIDGVRHGSSPEQADLVVRLGAEIDPAVWSYGWLRPGANAPVDWQCYGALAVEGEHRAFWAGITG